MVGVMALGKEKKNQRDLVKRDVGPEGRKSHKWQLCQQKKPEEEAGLGRGKGCLVWICGVEGLWMGIPSEEIQLRTQMSPRAEQDARAAGGEGLPVA